MIENLFSIADLSAALSKRIADRTEYSREFIAGDVVEFHDGTTCRITMINSDGYPCRYGLGDYDWPIDPDMIKRIVFP